MRGNRVNLKNVPVGAWVFLSTGLVAVIAAYVVMPLTGADAADLRSFINQLINLGTLVAAGGSVVYAGAAAKNAQDTKEQTNGLLDDERRQIAQDAAAEALKAAGYKPGGNA